MEEKRTPEEIATKRKELEQKKTNHRFRNMLLKFTLIGSGMLTSSTSANAQGFHYERVENRTEQQAPRQIIYGTPEWAEQQGYKYNKRLSIGINTRGKLKGYNQWEHHGYLGVWVNANTGTAYVLPKDPIADRHLVQEHSIAMIHTLKNANNGVGAGPFAPSNVGRVLYSRGTYRHGGWRY